jgi:hypothetical protein
LHKNQKKAKAKGPKRKANDAAQLFIKSKQGIDLGCFVLPDSSDLVALH